MRIVHWLFVVSVLLFVSGLGFVIAGARAAREAPTTGNTPASLPPVASVKQIMTAICGPASTVIFSAVSTTITAEGTEEKAPQTDAEWEAVGSNAAALIESGNLILIGGRAVDQGDWVKYAQDMVEGGKLALKATQGKSADGVLASGEKINESCDNCHMKYRRDL